MKNIAGLAVLVGMVFFLSACGSPAPQDTPTTDPGIIKTEAAQQAREMLTQQAQLTPSPTLTIAATMTDTPGTPAPTLPMITDTPGIVATATILVPNSANQGQYLSQTVADNSKFSPSQSFTITWKFKNIGKTTWDQTYKIRFYSGETFGSPASQKLPKIVKPGDEVDITLNLKAPSNPGKYNGSWVFSDTNDVNFRPFDLTIEVVPLPSATPVTPTATSAPATATPTPTMTSTPTP